MFDGLELSCERKIANKTGPKGEFHIEEYFVAHLSIYYVLVDTLPNAHYRYIK